MLNAFEAPQKEGRCQLRPSLGLAFDKIFCKPNAVCGARDSMLLLNVMNLSIADLVNFSGPCRHLAPYDKCKCIPHGVVVDAANDVCAPAKLNKHGLLFRFRLTRATG
ncbi:unnamed protein product [Symbiodinium natans]|uniref:Uncharacterized protein n=1 Tax=Symbiodinium natans TaxID=878477 RepID=A0A812SVT9_9DINO|nr:unnamed protein product [Symbiodinium natans]